MERRILHCDLNNFYASVECREHPHWKDLPLVVCGDPWLRHGVVLAKNQPAKLRGICTGQTLWEAQRLCPGLLCVPPRFDLYLRYSRAAREIYGRYTDQVEPFGIDECWLDVTGSERLFGPAEQMAHQIRREVKRRLGVTISVGVSFNKTFAKLASDLKKPDAVTVLPREKMSRMIWPLPAGELLGVGCATRERLAHAGIFTIGQLAQSDPKMLRRMLGVCGEKLWLAANGQEDAPVLRQEETPLPKSLGNSTTCSRDLTSREEVWTVLLALGEEVSRRMRRDQLTAGQVVLLVREQDRTDHSYGAPLVPPSRSGWVLAHRAMELFLEQYDFSHPVRALGIHAGGLFYQGEGVQLNLFEDPAAAARREELESRVDQLRCRYGKGILSRGTLMRQQLVVAKPGFSHFSIPGFHLNDR